MYRLDYQGVMLTAHRKEIAGLLPDKRYTPTFFAGLLCEERKNSK